MKKRVFYRNKRLKVSYSRPPGQDMKDSNLYITNLPKNVTEEDIDKMFSEYGEIVQRTVLKDKLTGMPRGVAFVRLDRVMPLLCCVCMCILLQIFEGRTGTSGNFWFGRETTGKRSVAVERSGCRGSRPAEGGVHR